MKNIANLFVLLILLLTNSIYAQVLELTHKQHGNHLYFNQGDKVTLDHIEKKDLKGKIMFFEDRLFIYPLLGKNNTETPLMHMRFDSIRMKDIREHGIQVDNISYDKTETEVKHRLLNNAETVKFLFEKGLISDLILEKLSAGETFDQLLQAHPRLTKEGIQAALQFAREALRADVVYPISESV